MILHHAGRNVYQRIYVLIRRLDLRSGRRALAQLIRPQFALRSRDITIARIDRDGRILDIRCFQVTGTAWDRPRCRSELKSRIACLADRC
jgi:hypothetical protein